MKRWLRWTLIVIVALFAVSYGGMWQQRLARYADAAPNAIAASTSDADVSVIVGENLIFKPLKAPERLGLILYPGAYLDIRGYAPVLKRIAAKGYRIVVVSMPFDLAILGFNLALDVKAANPDLKHWAIAGHSIGGAAGGVFAYQHPDAIDGVIFWDSFPPGITSLAEFKKPVWHIHRATPDGKPPESFVKQRATFPTSSHWVPVPGGIHMNFGAFSGGGYKEDWAPSISQEQQHDWVVDGTLQALADIEQTLAVTEK